MRALERRQDHDAAYLCREIGAGTVYQTHHACKTSWIPGHSRRFGFVPNNEEDKSRVRLDIGIEVVLDEVICIVEWSEWEVVKDLWIEESLIYE